MKMGREDLFSLTIDTDNGYITSYMPTMGRKC